MHDGVHESAGFNEDYISKFLEPSPLDDYVSPDNICGTH